MSYRKYILYGFGAIGLPLIWRSIGLYDINNVRKRSYALGLRTSQRFKKYPQWDKYVEPFIIKQSHVAFTSANSFIEGMVSDNENIDEIQQELDELRKKINEELDVYDRE